MTSTASPDPGSAPPGRRAPAALGAPVWSPHPGPLDEEDSGLLPSTHDPSMFVWRDPRGRTYRVDELGRDDLMQALCTCLQAAEALNAQSQATATVLQALLQQGKAPGLADHEG